MTAVRRVVIACALVMTALSAVAYLDRAFRFDEPDFALMVREGILVHGVPVIPPETQRWIMPDGRTHNGLWHPPLYQYALAAVSAVTPAANWPLRAFGLVCLALSLILGWRIVGRLVPDAPRSLRTLIASLPLLSPLVVESALYIDIDGTILLPCVLLVFERWIAWHEQLTPRRVALLAACLVLALSAKMTTPVIAIAAAGVHALASAERVRRIGALAAVGVGAALLLATAFAVYVLLTGYSLDYMLSLYATRAGQMTPKSLATYAFAARWNMAWTGPAVCALVLVALAGRVWDGLHERRVETVDVLWVFAIASAVAYVGVAAYAGKYMAPAVFCALLATGVSLSRTWKERAVPLWMLVATVAAAAALALALPSPRERVVVTTFTLAGGLRDPRTIGVVGGMLAALAFGLLSRVGVAGAARRAAAAMVVLTTAAVFSVVDQVRVVSTGNSGPLAIGGEQGFDEMLSCLHQLEGRPVVLAPKDVAYYYKGRSVPLGFIANADAFERLATRPDVGAIVDYDQRPLIVDPARFADWPSVQVGVYRLYVKGAAQLPSSSPTGCRSST